ncbi:MAG: hypothetical protein IKP92_08965 [Lachnospiraceae bacterium]|nr:hypothetical protein [Lachnospiraceae bacterium]
MNHNDLTKAFSVIMAAAIISSIGMVNTADTNTGDITLNTNTMISAPANLNLEDVEAVMLLKD